MRARSSNPAKYKLSDLNDYGKRKKCSYNTGKLEAPLLRTFAEARHDKRYDEETSRRGCEAENKILEIFSNNANARVGTCLVVSFFLDVLSREDRAKRTRRRSISSISGKKEIHTHPLHIHEVDVELRSLRSAHLLRHVLQREERERGIRYTSEISRYVQPLNERHISPAPLPRGFLNPNPTRYYEEELCNSYTRRNTRGAPLRLPQPPYVLRNHATRGCSRYFNAFLSRDCYPVIR